MKTRFLRGTTADNNGLTLPAGELSIDTERQAVRLHDGTTLGGFECVGIPVEIPVPGPQTLAAGTDQLGWYGTTQNDTLIKGDVLATELGISVGTAFNLEAPWMKFAYQGKTLFIPQKNIRYGINWNQLNQDNLIFGSRTLTLNGHTYQIRLMTGGNGDPSTASGGEWNELMYRVSDEDPTGTFWERYTITELGMDSSSGSARASYAQETISGNTANAVIRAANGNGVTHYQAGMKDTSSGVGWRPVLELVA